MEDTDLLQVSKPVTPLLPLSGSQALPLLHLVSNSCLSRYALNQVQQPPNLPKTLQLLVKRALSYEVLRIQATSGEEDLEPMSWTSG